MFCGMWYFSVLCPALAMTKCSISKKLCHQLGTVISSGGAVVKQWLLVFESCVVFKCSFQTGICQ